MIVAAPELSRLTGVRHAFFTRAGGTSEGLYASLNAGLGSRDDPARVAENRARMAAALDVAPDRLLSVYQIHSAKVVTVRGPWSGERPRADAMVTRIPGLALGVLTADCGPVLFADAEAGVVGAAHAGWKGALAGVLARTVDAMEGEGARRSAIVAVLGPTISRANYEVGPDFVAALAAAEPDASCFLQAAERPDRKRFDLPGFIIDRLGRAGVSQAIDLGLCTYAEPERFFSYRRSTHRGEPDYGRMLAGISLATSSGTSGRNAGQAEDIPRR